MVVKKRVCLYTFLESVIYFNMEKKFNFPCLLEKSKYKRIKKYTKIRLADIRRYWDAFSCHSTAAAAVSLSPNRPLSFGL